MYSKILYVEGELHEKVSSVSTYWRTFLKKKKKNSLKQGHTGESYEIEGGSKEIIAMYINISIRVIAAISWLPPSISQHSQCFHPGLKTASAPFYSLAVVDC